MKKLLLLLIPVIAISCGQQSNTPLAEEQKNKIEQEIKTSVTQLFDYVYKVDLQKYLVFYDSTDFTQIINGQILDWKTSRAGNQQLWAGLEYQKITINKEFIKVINAENVMYTMVGSDEAKFRNGDMFKADPIAITLLFVKKDSGWKITFYHGSVAFNVVPAQIDNALNKK